MTTVLAAGTLLALALLAIALNQTQARLSLLEVSLNDGLPPGLTAAGSADAFDPAATAAALGAGIHLVVSRSCHACHRLLDELGAAGAPGRSLQVHFVDRPRSATVATLESLGIRVHRDRGSLITELGLEPVPHTVAVGDHGLCAHGVSPTLRDVTAVAADAGVRT